MNPIPTEGISMEQHQKADRARRVKVAIDHFAMCESIRKEVSLPIDSLPLIDKLVRDLNQHEHHTHAHHDHVPGPHASMIRAPLRIESEKKIMRTDPSVLGTATPLRVRMECAMRVEAIEILHSPSSWMVRDIHVGNRSQFPNEGPPLSGHLFVPGGTCHPFVCETLQPGMEFTLFVHYVGDDPEGAIFKAVAMGHIAR